MALEVAQVPSERVVEVPNEVDSRSAVGMHSMEQHDLEEAAEVPAQGRRYRCEDGEATDDRGQVEEPVQNCAKKEAEEDSVPLEVVHQARPKPQVG